VKNISMRGTFAGIFDGMRTTPKEWQVILLHSKVLWYELAVNPLNEHVDVRDSLPTQMSAFKETYDEYLGRRFVYFICTRPRVRLAAKGGARLTTFRKDLHLKLEMGERRRGKTIVIPRAALTATDGERIHLPIRATSTPTSITLIYPVGPLVHFSIHDFLMVYGINLGAASKVEYVGYTKNPHTRPLNSQHRGLTEAIYKAGPAGEDVFIYYNTFQVTELSVNPRQATRLVLSNALIGAVDEDMEGRVVESAWIDYFRPATQSKTMEGEQARFSALKETLHKKHNITTLNVEYEVGDSGSDYFTLWSNSKPAMRCHRGSWNLPDQLAS
jgi:hypothetical protein